MPNAKDIELTEDGEKYIQEIVDYINEAIQAIVDQTPPTISSPLNSSGRSTSTRSARA